MFALVNKEFYRNKTSFIIYCLISIASAILYISLFPSIQEQSKQLSELMNSMPQAMMDAFGIDKDSFDSIEKYLAVELMTIFWPLLAILLSISRGGSCIAGDIENKTLGLELGLPISRTKVFVAKFLGGWASVLIFCFVSIFSIAPICYLFGIDIDLSKVSLLFILSVLFATSVFSVSLMLSAFLSEKGKVFFVIGGGLLASYVANIVASLNQSFDWLKLFSIFHYYDPLELLGTGNLRTTSIVFFFAMVTGSLVAGLWSFRSRDISI